MTKYIVPRNLEKEDTISIGQWDLTWKQVGYLVIGGIGTYLSFTSGFSISFKIILSILSFGISAIIALMKIQGYSLDQIAINSMIYAQRKAYYKNLEKSLGPQINISTHNKENLLTT